MPKKKENNHKSSEIGAMLEHIDDKVTLIAEQYTGLRKDVNIIKNDVGILKEDVEIIKMDIEFIKHDLKKKVDRDEFTVLERRVALLESKR